VGVDGTASGRALTGTGRRHLTPPPGSLLARARRKIAAPAGVPFVHTPAPATPAVTPSADWGAAGQAPTTASGTPMAWSPSAEPLRPVTRRRRWGLVVDLVGALAATAV